MCHQNCMESTTSGTSAGLGRDEGLVKGNLIKQNHMKQKKRTVIIESNCQTQLSCH